MNRWTQIHLAAGLIFAITSQNFFVPLPCVAAAIICQLLADYTNSREEE